MNPEPGLQCNWRSSLARAIHHNRKEAHGRYFQLATVKPDGRPANRTVVFRGFLDDTNQLKIITDARNQKYQQILHQPWGEACWYFTVTREQFRIEGELTVIDVNHPDDKLQLARNSTWRELSDNARLQFVWPHPGENRANPEEFSPPPPDAVNPPANFCLLLLDPVQVDHLELRGEPQNRWLYERDEDLTWTTISVNP
ncbi:Npun_F5749 family FMN-dependent PPOX-type flavoprotein [Iningainema tapete]|uniref:Pyridoxamine 5'-phosphate oxidase family protein n=1 Tax=Iningainema tapete BLCC-T55 TaxID=2748662 RepID=A0A8J6XJF2_9CYAN|nr:Npun_F5749 family FMN-dependent PPOX-type flavoprotein [Iningainema tapete]MBD2777995.1 pyridoxamine 5'-phosphate oxidase family protein [Iningainema tapete BLCC-T55]